MFVITISMWWGAVFILLMTFPRLALSRILVTRSGAFCDKTSVVFLNSNKFFKDKSVISLSPAGFYGFYVMGTCAYIKENYDLSDKVFSGASAGAWNALFLTLKTDPHFMTHLLVKPYPNKNVFEIELEMKDRLLKYYQTRDFDLERLFIGVTTLGQTCIYTDFENLEDAIDCCIASSHIPIVTGAPFVQRYRDQFCVFDGGFSKYPYINSNRVALHVSPKMWGQNQDMRYHLFKKDEFDLEELFRRGYRDTVLYGQKTLDKALTPRQEPNEEPPTDNCQ